MTRAPKYFPEAEAMLLRADAILAECYELLATIRRHYAAMEADTILAVGLSGTPQDGARVLLAYNEQALIESAAS